MKTMFNSAIYFFTLANLNIETMNITTRSRFRLKIYNKVSNELKMRKYHRIP
jgi:hypothetical protein